MLRGTWHQARKLAVANAEKGHSLKRIGHYSRGTSSIWGFNTPFRGTSWECECGEKGRINQAPSAGGEREARRQHQGHADKAGS